MAYPGRPETDFFTCPPKGYADKQVVGSVLWMDVNQVAVQ